MGINKMERFNVLENSFLLQTKATVYRAGMKIKIQLNGVFPIVTVQ